MRTTRGMVKSKKRAKGIRDRGWEGIAREEIRHTCERSRPGTEGRPPIVTRHQRGGGSQEREEGERKGLKRGRRNSPRMTGKVKRGPSEERMEHWRGRLRLKRKQAAEK